MQPDRDFQAGDVVVIRDWDDMADEFNADYDDSRIRVGDACNFVSAMKPLCGLECRISRVYRNSYGDIRINLDVDVDDWKISPGMLRRVDDASYKSAEVNRDQFISFISGE